MSGEIRIGMVGLDTSHSVAFTKCLQAPDVAADQKVDGARVISCMRFETPFQDKNGLDGRQKQLEEWGVTVTEDFDEAVAECEAIMLEINDPAYHLEYFRKCVPLGKPIFLDKPMADNTTNARAIYKLAKENNLRVFSASSLRFVPGLIESCKAIPNADYAYTYGALGKAPAGSSIVWYGVHAFEMLERAMGQGAIGVFARRDKAGVVCTIEYPNNRRGIVELTEGSSAYGGCLREKGKAAPYVCDNSRLYPDQLIKVVEFFNGAEPAASLEDALEVTAMLDAAERSTQSGKPEAL
ncbi:MAG: Gfo/Idh/MocA family protein [Armatimonadota bacterium]|jgi:predicted dehydrogenase